MASRVFIAAMLLAAALSIGDAVAAIETAPEPRAAVNLDRFMGRWNEIYRTPNKRQNACASAYQVWARQKEALKVVQRSSLVLAHFQHVSDQLFRNI